MKRLLGYLVLVSTLGCAAALAGDPAAPMSPAAAQPVRPAPLRLEKGTQALLTAVQAAEESKPKKPSFFGRRLKGLAMLVAGAAPFGAGYFGYSNLFAQEGAQRLVSSGPYTSGEATRLALWKLQYAQTEQEIYGTALGLVQPLLQFDPEAARRAAEGIRDPFWKASALAQMGEARLAEGQVEPALADLSQALLATRSGPTTAKASTARRVVQAALALHSREAAAAARLRTLAEPIIRDLKWTDEDAWASEQLFWAKVHYGALVATSDPRQATALLKSNRDEASRLRAAYLIALEAADLSRPDGTGARSLAEILTWLSADPARAAEMPALAHTLAGVKPSSQDEAKPPLRRIYDTFGRFETIGELTYLADQTAALASGHPDLAKELCLPLKRGASLIPYELRWQADGRTVMFQTAKKPKLVREQDPYYAIAGDELFVQLMLYGQRIGLESQMTGPLWEDYRDTASDFCDAWGNLVRSLYLVDPAACDEVLKAVQHRTLSMVGEAAISDLRPADAQAQALDRLAEAMRPAKLEWPELPSFPTFDLFGRKTRKALKEYEAQANRRFLASLEEQAVVLTSEFALRRLAATHPAGLAALLERDHLLRWRLTPDIISTLVATDPGEAAHVARLLQPTGTASLWDAVATVVGGMVGVASAQSTQAYDLVQTRFARHAGQLPEPERGWALDHLRSHYASLAEGLQKDPTAGTKYPFYMKGYMRSYREVEAERRKECFQQLADDWAGALSYLASVNLAEAEASASGLTDPYQACQSLRLAAQSAARTDPEGARRLLAQAGTRLQSVTDEKEQSQARADLAVATALLDADAGVALAAEIRDPAHRIWARALLAARLDASDADRATQLLGQAQLDLPLVKDPKRRAYVGCVLARAWLGADREQALAEADAPHLATVPW